MPLGAFRAVCSPMTNASSDLLLSEARRLDPDRSLCALTAAREDRDLLFALIIAQTELARVPRIVSQPITGMIRFQWWRDALTSDATIRGHPAAEALGEGLARGRLAPAPLQDWIDAHEEAFVDDEAESASQKTEARRMIAVRAGGLWARVLLEDPSDQSLEAAGEAARMLQEIEERYQESRRSGANVDRAAVAAETERRFAALRRRSALPRRLLPALQLARVARTRARALSRGADPALRPPSLAPALLFSSLRGRL